MIHIEPRSTDWHVWCSCGWEFFTAWHSDAEELASEHERLAECDW